MERGRLGNGLAARADGDVAGRRVVRGEEAPPGRERDRPQVSRRGRGQGCGCRLITL